jgi:hypothetical protein
LPSSRYDGITRRLSHGWRKPHIDAVSNYKNHQSHFETPASPFPATGWIPFFLAIHADFLESPLSGR